jgi:hypothetical protein
MFANKAEKFGYHVLGPVALGALAVANAPRAVARVIARGFWATKDAVTKKRSAK